MRARGTKRGTRLSSSAGALAILLFAGAWAATPRPVLAGEVKEDGSPRERREAGAGRSGPVTRRQGASTGPPARIQIAFKLDPRLTRSLYMGDRWVAPPTFTSTHPQGKRISVEARAMVVDRRGWRVPVEPRWTPSDPDLLAVSALGRDTFEIQVRRPGRAILRLEYGPLVEELVVSTVEHDGFSRVDISR